MMEAREQFCRSDAARLNERARAAANKVDRTKNMSSIICSAEISRRSKGVSHIAGTKNSQDSLRIVNEAALPWCYCRIDARIDGTIWQTVLSMLPDQLAIALKSSLQSAGCRGSAGVQLRVV
jgi:hypothetical protein